MDYREAYNYINSFTNFEQVPGLNYTAGLEDLKRVRLFMNLLDDPHLAFKSIVVAGSKGKGSVCAMLEAVLREAGCKTGLYTSPHLHTYRERIRVNGEMIAPGDVARLTETLRPVVEQVRALADPTLMPTTYELTTALAFLYFREQGIEVAVLEVGLGGRLDAVNVSEPLVSVISSISMDHMQVLGDTLAKIATEKAGIIKRNGTVISAPQEEAASEVIEAVAHRQGASLQTVGEELYISTGQLPEVITDDEGVPVYQQFTLRFMGKVEASAEQLRVELPLLGDHQQINAAVAVATLRALKEKGLLVSEKAITKGLAGVNWPGRLEVVHRKPVVVVDGAHNVASIAKLGEALTNLFHRQPVVLVLGITSDKDVEGIIEVIAQWSGLVSGPTLKGLIITRSQHPRAAPVERVADAARNQGLAFEVAESVPQAIEAAERLAGTEADPDYPVIIVVTGSLFVVAEARGHYGLAPDLSEE